MRDLRCDALVQQLLTEYSVDPSGLTLDEVDEAGVEEVD